MYTYSSTSVQLPLPPCAKKVKFYIVLKYGKWVEKTYACAYTSISFLLSRPDRQTLKFLDMIILQNFFAILHNESNIR